MNKTKQKLYPKGGVREILVVALPMFISQSFDTAMIFIDRLFLSKLGPEYMAAAMGGGLTAFMMMSFSLGLTSYTTALVAQYFGANKARSCGLVVTQAFIFSLIAYVPLLVFKVFGHWLFEFIGIDQNQIGLQKSYFDILMYGSIFSLFRNCLSCYFSGIGRTRIVTISSFIAMLVNISLNYILIFGKFGFQSMGITGAAIGTVVGGFVGFLILLIAYLNKNNDLEFAISETFKFNKEVFKKLLQFGSSQGFEMFLNILAFNALVLTFHSYGIAAATASTIVFNWDLVSFVPLIGIEIAVTSMVGRFMGARDPETAHKSVISGLKIAFCYSSIMLVLFLFFPVMLVDVFRPEQFDLAFEHAAVKAVFMLRVTFLYVFAESVFVVFTGALRGAGDTFWTMVLSVFLHWTMFITSFILIKVIHLPIETVWITVVLIFMATSLIIYLRYRSGKWKHLSVVTEQPNVSAINGFHEIDGTTPA